MIKKLIGRKCDKPVKVTLIDEKIYKMFFDK